MYMLNLCKYCVLYLIIQGLRQFNGCISTQKYGTLNKGCLGRSCLLQIQFQNLSMIKIVTEVYNVQIGDFEVRIFEGGCR